MVVDIAGVKVALHRSKEQAATEPQCIFIHIHGGGWVNGTVQSIAQVSQYIANKANCIVAAVEYRLGTAVDSTSPPDSVRFDWPSLA